jgi:hypothetical protein
MTQRDMIIGELQNGGTITNVEAVEKLGIARLASRIHDLKKRGIPISYRWEEGLNRRGDKCRYKRYFLRGDDEQQTEG